MSCSIPLTRLGASSRPLLERPRPRQPARQSNIGMARKAASPTTSHPWLSLYSTNSDSRRLSRQAGRRCRVIFHHDGSPELREVAETRPEINIAHHIAQALGIALNALRNASSRVVIKG